MTLESVAITRIVVEALQKQGEDLSRYPLLSHIYDMVEKGERVNIPWAQFER